MNEHVSSIFFGALTLLAVLGVGYKIRKERERLRRLVHLLGEEDREFARMLEALADSGRVKRLSVG